MPREPKLVPSEDVDGKVFSGHTMMSSIPVTIPATTPFREENPVSKFFDSLLGGIPILGFLTGYLFHPRYGATKSDGQIAMRLTKQPAFLEGKFAIEKLDDSLTPHQEMNLVLSFMMMILLERRRG